jgi:multiple sugar transport system substrate-binding protein
MNCKYLISIVRVASIRRSKIVKYHTFLSIALIVGILFSAAPVLAQEPTEVTTWRHTSDLPAEIELFTSWVEDFNASQDDWEIVWEELPQDSYEDSIAAATLADTLPCMLDVDGPFIPNYAWAGNIIALDDYISDELRADTLPSALGTYGDSTYAIGMWDAALAIWARRSVLEENGIRIPEGVDDPWTKDEFDAILEQLAALDEFDMAIDMVTFYTHEWWPYAYSPLLQSFGGDLIDRETYLTAEGVLNGPEAIAWGEWWQNLFVSGLSDPNAPDDQAFIQGRAALMYIGNWYYPTLLEAWGDDLIIIPPVDFGNGPKIGGASWQWAISSSCENPDGAWAFIEYLLQPENVAAAADVTGLIPARLSAAPLTENYSETGPLGILVEFSNAFTVVRPPTPAYGVIRNEFREAAQSIANGADVQDSLDDAVDAINADIEDNDGYGF